MILTNDEIVVEIITDPQERKKHERMIKILEEKEKLAQEARQRMDALQHAEIEQHGRYVGLKASRRCER